MQTKDLKFYRKWEDDSGHTKLIPQEQWLGFCMEEQRLSYKILCCEHYSDEFYEAQAEYDNFIDSFKTLEGESHFIVLEEEIPFIIK